MKTSDKNNTGQSKNETQILTDLYKQNHQDSPPKTIDDIILAHAKSSDQGANKNKNWRPWLAAASLVLVLPLIWLLTQNQIHTGAEPVIQPKATPKPDQQSSNEQPMSSDVEAVIEAELIDLPVTTSPKRARNKPAPLAPATDFVEMQETIEEQARLSITGRPIDRASLNANKEKLMAELKAKKRTIKPSTISPLMALEYEQFGRYLERGQFDLADQLLTDMQESWPEYDYEEMIYRLALAEANSSQ